MSKSQKKKQAQAAAAAASKDMDAEPVMPVMPDKRVKYLWSGDPSVREFDFSKFVQIWPAYIDSNLTLEKGRRLNKEHCCASPNVGEMSEVCQAYKLRHVMEPYKMYPRLFGVLGRLRVRIFNDDGTPCHPEIQSKKDLLKKMGELIPRLNSRIKREQEAAAAAAANPPSATPQVSNTSSSSSSNKKKKSKK